MKMIGQRQLFDRGWIAFLACLALGAMSEVTFAQGLAPTGEASPQASGSSTTLQTYQQEQLALGRERQTLVSQGATQQQLEAWRQQNAARFQAQQQLAQALALASALQPMPVAKGVNIPANASGTLKDFLTTEATLANARAQIHNQLLQALPSGASQEISAMQQQEGKIFRQQHAGDLQLQQQRAQSLATESASQPIPIPGPAVIPSNATPQLKAYLTAQNALAIDRAQFWNQYVTADPAVRQAAMQQWRKQNADRLQQLTGLAEALSGSATNQQERNTQ
jgi:hypothetical protein